MAEETGMEELKEYLKTEYQEVRSMLLFFAGARFAFLASFGTFFAVTMSAYNAVWRSRGVLLGFWKLLLIFVPAFGFVVTIVAWLIEQRTVVLYQTCLVRGLDLEKKLGITREEIEEYGIYRRLITSLRVFHVLGLSITHTLAIGFLYVVVLFVWLVLLFFGFYQLTV